MQYNVQTIEEYLAAVPEDKAVILKNLRKVILKNLPKGFEESLCYNMIGYVIPHSLYPAGYHCKPEQALPFINIAAQKNFVALYHMGLYADKELLEWFTGEYPKHCKYKLDMGKSCIRFKKQDDIPYDLIAQLVRKMTPEDWINLYEKNLLAGKK